ncbi:MAG: hypothetical protein ABF649_07230 [Bacillus sp. (in: firmicutes)]
MYPYQSYYPYDLYANRQQSGGPPSFPPQGQFLNIPGLGNFFPPFGGGQPSQPSFPGGGGGGGNQGAPTTPPPSFTPQLQQQSVGTFKIDAGSMQGCLFRFTYVWLNNGNGFWFYPTFVGRNSVAGFRWRNFRWTYYGTDADRIRSFQCT